MAGNRKNKPADGEVNNLGQSSNPVYGAVPKTQPWKLQQMLKICSWNIRRGLLKRELELKDMLNSEKLNIMFLVETDTKMLHGKNDYKIEGYETILQKTNKSNEKIRIICLVKEETFKCTKIREDLMSSEFPTIWLEITRNNQKNLLVCGFYREWTRNGNNTENEQSLRLKIIIDQMERATRENKSTIMLGDANLCAHKWDEEDYRLFNLAAELKTSLAQCGLESLDIGKTYMADRLRSDGTIIESALDHIYVSHDQNTKITAKKLDTSSTDHLPIMAEINIKAQQAKKATTIHKRSMKNFTQQKWIECLAGQEWEDLGRTDDVNEMAQYFNNKVVEALDECAPWKKIKIQQNYKFGVSDKTKELIKERDGFRKSIHMSPNEKKILHDKYKKLRNRVTNQIRRDTRNFNEERIDKAGDEKEIWKLVNEVIKPKDKNQWKLKEGEEIIENGEEIANIFNKFFIEKICLLKSGIDPKYVKEPLAKLRKKMEQKNIKFSLKTVTEKMVYKAISSLKKKKSSGIDGISQEQLVLGAKVLVVPLTRIINNSITTGEFPSEWKEALVTPILKKGDPTKKENYRPVSCLSVASKVLEKIVCDQVTNYMEMHEEWIQNSDNKLKTGILLWDLSAAYDTLCPSLFCEKLKIYGFDKNACKWFMSFLTNRSQRVKIGASISEAEKLVSGVPQGGILSPIIFIIYGADMEEWITHSSIYNYADDTASSCQDKKEQVVIEKLEEDAESILQFMASNGLVANPSKTVFMMLNSKTKENELARKIKVGNHEIPESKSAKLLGVVIDNDQKWKSHFCGKGGLLSSLNQRLFMVRRLSNHISKKKLHKIVDSLWTSKLRYGLQLCTEVRLNEDQPKSQYLTMVQRAQNKMLRVLDGSMVTDRKRTKTILDDQNMLSVNQIAAQIKLTEMWKASNDPHYPIKMKTKGSQEDGIETRSITRRDLTEVGRSTKAKKSFTCDAAKVWNKAPDKIKIARTLASAKKAIKEHCKSLPI